MASHPRYFYAESRPLPKKRAPRSFLKDVFRTIILPVAILSLVFYIITRPSKENKPRAALSWQTPAKAEPSPPINETAVMATFWNDYRQLMTAVEDYDEWFADADAATRAIQAMFVVLPPPGSHEKAIYKEMLRLIEWRNRQMKLAQLEWNAFHDARDRLVYDMVAQNAPWSGYVDREREDSKKKRLDTTEVYSWKSTEAAEGGKYGPLDRQTLEAVAFSTHQTTDELVRIHTALFENWDPAHTHLREARGAEMAFIATLRRLSSKGITWTSQNAVALPVLTGRMEKLQAIHERMETALGWLRERFPSDAPDNLEEQAAWLRSAAELLEAWAQVLADTQEGVLYMLRRRDVRSKAERLHAEASWKEWKERNCGDTSCYDAPSMMGSVSRFFGQANPLAEVAEDETMWIKSLGGDGTPRIRRSVYDKACCRKGTMLHHQLKHGARQTLGGFTTSSKMGRAKHLETSVEHHRWPQLERYVQ
ncbi:hypothetical protein F4824DRAFT_280950 [Ustulina deusta]|nr:hypothetical protein F4824DRAFT_280950 [Ustulina deusta]